MGGPAQKSSAVPMQQKMMSVVDDPLMGAASSTKRSPFFYPQQLQKVPSRADSRPATPRKAVKHVPHGSDVDEKKMVSPTQAFTIFMLVALAAVLLFCILGEYDTSSGFMGSAG